MPRCHRFLIWALLTIVSGCAQLQPRPDLPEELALSTEETSPLDALAIPAEARHPGQSGFRLVIEGTEAFVARAHSARLATRSLDVQTYIWHTDLTGIFFAHELLTAADRGVKVRLLVDDLDARGKNEGVAALSAHPNIAVRLFNPFASRKGKLRLIGEGLASFRRLNRRMHNKSWIADNRLAIVGGRNVGDEYFGASEATNFVDLDLAMAGPVVRDISASFDRYWNSASAYPIELLDATAVSTDALGRLRDRLRSHVARARDSRYAAGLREDDAIRRMLAGDWPLQWTRQFAFIADDPAKVTMREREAQRTQVGAALGPLLKSAETQVSIISPYFVPGQQVTAGLVASAQSGRHVRVLTNSLVANDVAAVHGGYSRYRKALVQGGVQLWELKPQHGGVSDAKLLGSSGASLHTKAFAIDGHTLFVGSYNLDPRSTWLNCEQGVLVTSVPLATQIEALFALQTEARRAWRVTLEAERLQWSDGARSYDSDPMASFGRRFQAWLTRVLHLDAQL